MVSENVTVGNIIHEFPRLSNNNLTNLVYNITEESQSGYFNIIDGYKLRVARSLDLESTRITSFSLILTDDLGDKTFVNITVDDMNDNAPVFQGSLYGFSIYSNSVNGTLIGSILAVDNDFSSKNSQVKYFFPKHFPGPFRLMLISNRIYLASNVTGLGGQIFDTMVMAHDGRNSGSTIVRVIISDMHLNQPGIVIS